MFCSVVIPLMMSAMLAPKPAAQARVAPAQRPPTTKQQVPQDPLQEIEALLQKGQLAEAEQKLQPVMADQAKNPQAWFDLGYIESHLGKTAEAITAYKKAVELQPDWFEANLNLGIDLDKAGNTSEALAALKHAVELKPTSAGQYGLARAWMLIGQALEPGDLLGAARAYDKAAEANPSDLGLAMRAGSDLERADDLAGAEAHYVKVAKTGDPGAMAHLIDLLNRQKRYRDAEAWLRKYIEQKPEDYSAIGLLGQVLIAEGRVKDAIALLQPQSRPLLHSINSQLVAAYMEDKQFGAAVPLLQEQVGQNPSDAELRMRLGYALLRELKYAEAENELLKAVQLKPNLAEAYGYLADAARQNKHYELCIRVLDARSRLLPETPGTYFLRATAYDELHMIKPAMANYKQFLSVAEGKYPDQEFQARHRLKALEH
ncbi:MAG TPA: tetratricopeptide repeat protein [Candidatus Angelobacter sp.]|nr:tetratricopeptide repeat protein [Candidatus Angelobacter sp.]